MPFCPPCRNDSSLGFRYIGVYQRDLQTVYELKRRSFENPDRILEGDSVTRNIPPTLVWGRLPSGQSA